MSAEEQAAIFAGAVKRGDFEYLSPMSESEKSSLVNRVQTDQGGSQSLEEVKNMENNIKNSWTGAPYSFGLVLAVFVPF